MNAKCHGASLSKISPAGFQTFQNDPKLLVVGPAPSLHRLDDL
jgi:hypothetical protein